jgi:hypothetical protein
MKVLYWVSGILVVLSISALGSMLLTSPFEDKGVRLLIAIVWGYGVGWFGAKVLMAGHEALFPRRSRW